MRQERLPGSAATLLLASVTGLFLELMLVRWIGTEVRIFAYLQNAILVVCFLGLGMGCWTSDKPVVHRNTTFSLCALALLFAVPGLRNVLASISTMISEMGGLLIWGTTGGSASHLASGVLGLCLTFGLMLLVWMMFVPLGRLLGRELDAHPRPVFAYSVNVFGSLLGVWCFVGLSAGQLPPVVWMLVLASLLGWLFHRAGLLRSSDGLVLLLCVGLAWGAAGDPGSRAVVWSPYQKLTLYELGACAPSHPYAGMPGSYLVNVNNVLYQVLLDLTPAGVASEPARFDPAQRGLSEYDLPMLFHPDPHSVLCVGAGTGNDAAGALRHGVKDVVAVEIDPAIIAFGRAYHPEKPYSNPAVRVYNDDARSYFATGPAASFDVISFGLLDSHTTTAMTNARLDHYVYTRESIRQARRLLKPGGVICLTFEAEKQYIIDRIGTVLEQEFDGKPPICFHIPTNAYGWGGVMFVTGDLDVVRRQLEKQPALRAIIDRWKVETPVRYGRTDLVCTDDWPYIYLEKQAIPSLYGYLNVLLALLFMFGVHRIQAAQILTNWTRSSTHFFFLGAAFMLLEVANISRTAVVLGNTWTVNAVIISAILFLALMANGLAGFVGTRRLGIVYAALCLSCLGLYRFDITSLSALPYATKAVAVGCLTCCPMLFSGIIFVHSFARAPERNVAFGANLMGSLVGGLLQSVTFITGINALVLMVAGLYACAWLTRPKA